MNISDDLDFIYPVLNRFVSFTREHLDGEPEPSMEECENAVLKLSKHFKSYQDWYNFFFELAEEYDLSELEHLLIAGKKLFPNSSIFYACYVELSLHLGISERADIAFKNIEKAIMIDPENPNLYVLRGIMKQVFKVVKNENRGDKYEDWQKAIELDPRCVNAYETIAGHKKLEGKNKEAIENYKKVLLYGNEEQKGDAAFFINQLK
ncbi:MAG: hypothetical protein EAZ08_13340 [Cytophagales bacterium]|nr:MAG: hypothetical protein EAZ08_13340 [Cytophagales bacterium]